LKSSVLQQGNPLGNVAVVKGKRVAYVWGSVEEEPQPKLGVLLKWLSFSRDYTGKRLVNWE